MAGALPATVRSFGCAIRARPKITANRVPARANIPAPTSPMKESIFILRETYWWVKVRTSRRTAAVINLRQYVPSFAKAAWRLVFVPFPGERAKNTILESKISATARL